MSDSSASESPVFKVPLGCQGYNLRDFFAATLIIECHEVLKFVFGPGRKVHVLFLIDLAMFHLTAAQIIGNKYHPACQSFISHK